MYRIIALASLLLLAVGLGGCKSDQHDHQHGSGCCGGCCGGSNAGGAGVNSGIVRSGNNPTTIVMGPGLVAPGPAAPISIQISADPNGPSNAVNIVANTTMMDPSLVISIVSADPRWVPMLPIMPRNGKLATATIQAGLVPVGGLPLTVTVTIARAGAPNWTSASIFPISCPPGAGSAFANCVYVSNDPGIGGTLSVIVCDQAFF